MPQPRESTLAFLRQEAWMKLLNLAEKLTSNEIITTKASLGYVVICMVLYIFLILVRLDSRKQFPRLNCSL